MARLAGASRALWTPSHDLEILRLLQGVEKSVWDPSSRLCLQRVAQRVMEGTTQSLQQLQRPKPRVQPLQRGATQLELFGRACSPVLVPAERACILLCTHTQCIWQCPKAHSFSLSDAKHTLQTCVFPLSTQDGMLAADGLKEDPANHVN